MRSTLSTFDGSPRPRGENKPNAGLSTCRSWLGLLLRRWRAHPRRDPRELALGGEVGLVADDAAVVDALEHALIDGENAAALAREGAKEAHQVGFVQQPEIEPHHGLAER